MVTRQSESRGTSPGYELSFYRRYGKRMLDIAAAAALLMLLAPVMLVVALLVRSQLGSPVLFTQLRPGVKGQPFRLFKFRTMTAATDAAGLLLPDERRMTSLGQTLRRLSLDELPELLNVIRGEMSLVGPRPLLMEYLPLYTPQQRRRHDVRPGITGLAQVAGRNSLSWEDRFRLDVEYVERVSLRLDLAVLIRTVVTVILGRGVSQAGFATAERFRGSKL